MSEQETEDQVVKHLSWGAISFIERPSSKVLAFALSSLVMAFIIFLAVSVFFKIDLSVKVSGQINSIDGIKNAIVQKDGVIEGILISPGENVKKDQVIAKLKIQGSSEAELETAKNNLNLYLHHLKNKTLTRKEVVPFVVKINDALLRSQFVDCEKKLSSYFYLNSIGLQNFRAETDPLNSRLQFLSTQLKRVEGSIYRNDLLVQKYGLQDEMGRLKAQLATIENGMQLKLQEAAVDLERHLEIVLASLDLFLDAHLIKSPIDGKVLRFHQLVGSNIRSGETFASLVPDSSLLVGEVLVPSRDISRVKEAANVWVSIDSYPRNKYGYFKGRVLSIEKLKSSTHSLKNMDDEAGYLAKISIDLDDYKRNPASAKRKIQLMPGMKVDVQIVWKKTSLLGMVKSNFVGEEE
jgi:multidrug resistance efflux pump